MPIVDDYLAALEAGDLSGVLNLFSKDGIVHSPLYGDLPAGTFYEKLFEDTGRSKLRLRRVLSDGDEAIAFWFDFDWTLQDGSAAPFTVMDLAELDADGRIQQLHIIYDTHPIREAFNRATTSGG